MTSDPDTAAPRDGACLRWEALAAGAPMRAVQADLPPPAAGEVRVEIGVCALNHADLLMLDGRYQEQPDPPIVPGLEFAGRIVAAGPGVAPETVGRRVAVLAGHGGLAQAANVAQTACVPIPDGLDDETAAGLLVAHGTAALALGHRARLRPEELLVVTGAGGGTGLAGVETGAAMGARVVAVARGPEKRAAAEAAGAVQVIDPEREDLRAAVRALGGADVVFDTVGGASWDALFRAVRPEARLLPIGFAGGGVPQIQANHVLVKNLTVIGVNLGAYRRFAPDVLTGALSQAMRHAAEGRCAVRIGARYPFSEAPSALDALRRRAVAGKILVTVRDS